MGEDASHLDLELELIESSLLPAESLRRLDSESRVLEIRSGDSHLWIRIEVSDKYPSTDGLKIEVKSDQMGRDEAEDWTTWVQERMEDFSKEDDYPLYQLLTVHFLPILAPSPPSPSSLTNQPLEISKSSDMRPHHVLLSSHHILSPTKRKNLISLSSQLSLVGFAKIGHPGIMYAIGFKDDLVEWLREVKSWNWLALRIRVGVEPIPDPTAEDMGSTRGSDKGARGGKGRGEWNELEKIAEALEWLKIRSRDNLLLDIGMGAGGK